MSDNMYLVCRDEHLALIMAEAETFDDTRVLPGNEMVIEARLRTENSRARLEEAGVQVLSQDAAREYIDKAVTKPRRRKVADEE